MTRPVVTWSVVTWHCALRQDLADRGAAISAGLGSALEHVLRELGVPRTAAVTVEPVAIVPAGSWAIHRLDGRRVGRDQEPARRALALTGQVPVASAAADPWATLRELDDAALSGWAGWTVRGVLAANPALALGPEPAGAPATAPDGARPVAPTGLRAAWLDQGWSLDDVRMAGALRSAATGNDNEHDNESGDAGWDVPALDVTRMHVSPGLLRWLTSPDAGARGLLHGVVASVQQRVGVLAPAVVVRPDPTLPESSFTFRSGILGEVPYGALRPTEVLVRPGTQPTTACTGVAVDPRTGTFGWRIPTAAVTRGEALSATEHVRRALLEHLLGVAYRFVDVHAMTGLLERLEPSRPQLVRRVLRDVGIGSLRAVLRALLRERLGIPCLPALLRELDDVAGGGPPGGGFNALVAAGRRASVPVGVDPLDWGSGIIVPTLLGPRGGDLHVTLNPLRGGDEDPVVDRLIAALDRHRTDATVAEVPVILAEPAVAEPLRAAVAAGHPRLSVLGLDALSPGRLIRPLPRLVV